MDLISKRTIFDINHSKYDVVLIGTANISSEGLISNLSGEFSLAGGDRLGECQYGEEDSQNIYKSFYNMNKGYLEASEEILNEVLDAIHSELASQA